MKNIIKIISVCLTLCLLVNLCPISETSVHAASNGDKRSYTETLTLQEVSQLADKYEEITNSLSFWGSVSSVTLKTTMGRISPKLSTVAGFAVLGVTAIPKADLKREYKFYKNVRSNMIKKNAKKVTIKYTQIYRVNRMYGDYTGGWYAYSKSVSKYIK